MWGLYGVSAEAEGKSEERCGRRCEVLCWCVGEVKVERCWGW